MITDWYTILCVFLIIINVVRSSIRGFSKEFLSFIGMVIGLIVGLNYYQPVGIFLGKLLSQGNSWIFNIAGFLALFLPIVMLFSWTGLLFRKIFEKLDIIWIDAVLGFFMGIVKGMFWILIVTLVILNFSYLQFLNSYIYQSRFYQDLTLPIITYLNNWVTPFPQADFLHNIFLKGILKEDAYLGNFEEF
ncbi:MAG: CvpA family protein [Candidatus Caldatribacteriaceae bacterium]